MKSTALAASVLALVAGASVHAQVKPEDAIRARQSIMRVVGLNFGPLAGMAQDKVPFNKETFAVNAARLESVWAMNATRFFVPGSDKPVAGAKTASFTDVKPEIWSQPDKFKSAAEKMGVEIGKVAAAAKGGDEKAMKAAVDEAAKACKVCHDDFRVK